MAARSARVSLIMLQELDMLSMFSGVDLWQLRLEDDELRRGCIIGLCLLFDWISTHPPYEHHRVSYSIPFHLEARMFWTGVSYHDDIVLVVLLMVISLSAGWVKKKVLDG